MTACKNDFALHPRRAPMPRKGRTDRPLFRSGKEAERPRVSPEPLDKADAVDTPYGFAIRDEANALVAWAFRNGPIEDLHAGRYSELLEDSTLSRITSPIRWP